MQTCPECGGRNEDGELFCGECGSYLEWAETAQEPVVAAPGSPADDAVLVEDAALVDDNAASADDGAALAEEAALADDGVLAGDGGEGAASDDGALAGARGDAVGAGGEDPEPESSPAPETEESLPAASAADDAGAGHDDGRRSSPSAVGAAGAGLLGGLGAAGVAGRLGSRSGRARGLLRSAADEATGGRAADAQRAMSRASAEASRVTGRTGTATRRARAAVAPTSAPAPAVAAPAASGPTTGRTAAAPAPERPAPAVPPAGKPTTPAPARPAPTQPRKPEPRQPAARKPGAPVPRRKVRPAAEEEPPPNPGDLICGACGAGNAPHRNFCRRCGASLADAPVQPRRSWWRRLLRPDPRPAPVAGTRRRTRGRRRFPTGLVVTLLVLALVGAAGWYFREPIIGAYESVVDRAAGNNPVNPSGVSASSELEGRPASQARDGISNRSWAPEPPGEGEWIEFEFAEPYRLVTVLVTAGSSPNDDERLLEARPQRVRLTYTTAEGEEIQDVTLTDTGGAQEVAVGTSDVEAVRLTILSVYGAELRAPVAVAEVEFRGRS